MIGSNFFTSEGRIRAVMYMPCVKCSCSELKLAKHLQTFFVLTKLKKSRTGFELVTVLISEQSFFQHRVWPVYQGKSYLHGIALPDFLHSLLILLQNIKTSECTYLCLAFV